MKTITAATALLSLAACDSGGVVDQGIREGVRQSAAQACAAWIPQSDIALAAGLAPDRLCACAADRILEGKNVTELAAFRLGGTEIRAAIIQCAAEVQGRPKQAEAG